MRRRKNPSEVMEVTSFRLPKDVKAFLRRKADEGQRTMSFILIDYMRRWIHFESEETKQPKVKK